MLRHRATPAILSAIIALITFSITLRGTYIYDDFDVFGNDARLHHPDQWKNYWTDSYNGGVDNLYRPLVSMTYAIQWWIHDDTKWPYHAVNLILHAAVAACVAEFTRRLTATRSGALRHDEALRCASRLNEKNLAPTIAGVLFAVHPIHVEAVANIVGRAELLSALGVLCGLILFLHRPLTVARSIAILGCFLIAALSKENGMLLPFLLLALAVCIGYRPRNARERRATLTLTLLLSWALASYLVLREVILNLKFEWERNLLDWTINPMIRSVGVDRALMPLVILGRYAALLIAPVKLSPDYGGNVIGSHVRYSDPYLYLGAATVIACVFAFAIAIKKRWSLAAFCLIAFALTYSIVSNFFFLIGTNFGERLMYLPSAFFIILIAMAIAWFLPRRGAIVVTAMLVILGGARSIVYASKWNDRLTFYQWASREQPSSIRLRMLKVAELQSQNRLDEAAAVASSARELLPQYDEIWVQSADVAMARNDFASAEKFLKHAMTLHGQGTKAAGRLEVLYQRRAATQSN